MEKFPNPNSQGSWQGKRGLSREKGADNRAGRRERERERERERKSVERYGGGRRMVVGSLQSALTRSTVRRTAAPTRQVTCMAKKGKQVRVIVTLECTEQKGSGIPGMSRYNTTKVRMREDSPPDPEPLSTLLSPTTGRNLAPLRGWLAVRVFAVVVPASAAWPEGPLHR